MRAACDTTGILTDDCLLLRGDIAACWETFPGADGGAEMFDGLPQGDWVEVAGLTGQPGFV